MATSRPIIRNLDTLRADMAGELRQALYVFWELKQVEPQLSIDTAMATLETKIRNVLEYLTGQRE